MKLKLMVDWSWIEVELESVYKKLWSAGAGKVRWWKSISICARQDPGHKVGRKR